MWEAIKYAAGLDALSGVKYHPTSINQWCKINAAKLRNRSDKDAACRELTYFGNYPGQYVPKCWGFNQRWHFAGHNDQEINPDSHRLTAERPLV